MFGNKMIYVTDPVALNAVIAKNNQHYEEAYDFRIATRLLFGPSLLSSTGEAHRKERRLLLSIFSTSNLRDLTPVVASIGTVFRKAITSQIPNGSKDIDMHRWCTRVVLEMIGRAVLDYSFDPLNEEIEDDPALYDVPLHFFLAILWAKLLGITKTPQFAADWYPSVKVKRAKKLWDTLWDRGEVLVNERLASENSGEGKMRKDILSTLVRINLAANEKDRLTHDELVAQISTIIFGAVDTTTNTTSRMLHTLALNPEAQERLRLEILSACSIGEPSYEQISGLPFLDAVYRETIRAYPSVHVMNRETQRPTILPVWRPIEDSKGRMVNEIILDKGVTVTIGIHGYNRSKAVWGEDAEEWRPERWLSPLPEAVRNVPSGGIMSNTLTFMGGHRSCIGFKYAEIQIKIILFNIFRTFKLSPANAEVVWNTSRVAFPSVKNEDDASMPLRVELIGTTA
ncbi:cytochrome P450-dit2 [Steccherinum ochraceum]|uniref:Cytochrome P450-dit2 n=1 Tax=Steccherinum ochraceum TaxID=92696 RepID=A0A4R0R6R6_9APHY|nr:cytochrome P450-dit2 [Steccherinum ochraceum]